MSDEHLRELQLTSEQLCDGILLKAWRDEVRLPNGRTSVREYIKHPGAVIMVPLFADATTILVKQFRYPVGRTFVELPAGKLDGNEPAAEAVQRELAEETGHRSKTLTKIAEYYPCIGYSDEKMWLYLAEDLVSSKQEPEADEFIECMRIPFASAVDKVYAGEIEDLKSIAGILLVNQFLQNSK